MTTPALRSVPEPDDLAEAAVNVVFMDPPEIPGRPIVGKHAQIAEILRSRPGQWARIMQNVNSGSYAQVINKGKMRAYQPAGDYQGTERRNSDRTIDIYARYVGSAR